MDLKIPNIIKPIALKEYAEEFGEVVIWVWVNPPKALRFAWAEDMNEEQVCAWLSELWSQGAEETRFTPEDVLKFGNTCMERDPRLWIWLFNKTIELMNEHYIAKKKPLITPQ